MIASSFPEERDYPKEVSFSGVHLIVGGSGSRFSTDAVIRSTIGSGEWEPHLQLWNVEVEGWGDIIVVLLRDS